MGVGSESGDMRIKTLVERYTGCSGKVVLQSGKIGHYFELPVLSQYLKAKVVTSGCSRHMPHYPKSDDPDHVELNLMIAHDLT